MNTARMLITGGSGMLASVLAEALRARGADVVALDRRALDVTDSRAVLAAIAEHEPGIVIQCAAFTRVDDAERDPARAHAVNEQGTANVARACAALGARLIYPSTDYVFDGRAQQPYAPDAPTNPVNVYGRSKLGGEQAARLAGDYLIIRTGWLYGPGGRNFVRLASERARAHTLMSVVDDQRGAPTWTVDLADRFTALMSAHPAPGVYHLTNAGSATWYELAVETARLLGVDAPIARTTSSAYASAAKRPAYSVLDCARTEAMIGAALPWQVALARAIESGLY
jgi:dTDP-4-dehydrorhamnose reductase